MAGCKDLCHRIYSRQDEHTTPRRKGFYILGNKAQFCESFYHVHEWGDREHVCLDENNCGIARRACKIKEKDWTMQPKTVVAFAKYEVDGKTKYEARYTNCYNDSEHAEEFLDLDIRCEKFNDAIIDAKEKKTKSITLYLTYQPCNKSTRKTKGTKQDQSCCDTIQQVYTEVLAPGNISLCIKAAHTLRLDEYCNGNAENKKLRKNAICGIQNLKGSGVSVSGMTKEDWEYLFTLTSAENPDDVHRNFLDADINRVLAEIPPQAKRRWNIVKTTSGEDIESPSKKVRKCK